MSSKTMAVTATFSCEVVTKISGKVRIITSPDSKHLYPINTLS